MTRIYYRLCVTALCALAALVGPRIFVWEPFRLGFLLGGLAAALLTWLFLVGALAVEPTLKPLVLGILGAGAAVLSWMRVTMVAVFDRIPLMLAHGWKPFDPVWVLGGFSPVLVLFVAWWIARSSGESLLDSLYTALYRFSVPLAMLQVVTRVLDLPKQYHSLFLFTGIMFVLLDGLGTGGDLPLSRSGRSESEQR